MIDGLKSWPIIVDWGQTTSHPEWVNEIGTNMTDR